MAQICLDTCQNGYTNKIWVEYYHFSNFQVCRTFLSKFIMCQNLALPHSKSLNFGSTEARKIDVGKNSGI